MFTVYKDRSNTFSFQLTMDGVALSESEMQEITKVEVLFKKLYFNSDDYPAAFDWDSEASDGKIIFSLGLIDTIPKGRDANSELIIYSPTFVDGRVWDLLDIQVITLVGSDPV
jgi:hypothetical protein